MRLIRHLCVCLLAASVVAVVGAAAASGASAGCNDRSWVGGITEICFGTLVYRDYVYDDYGADTGAAVASSTGALAQPRGDVRYERDVNSADLVSLRLRIRGNRLEASFELNTLLSPDSTVAALAIDTDDNRDTPTDGAGAPAGSRPWDNLGVSSAGWEVLALFDRGDPATNLIEGSIPLPPGSRWRVQAVTAVKPVTAVKRGPVMNVAFRGSDERGRWWEDLQAEALERGDISSFGYEVEVADLRTRATRPADVLPGVHERVYESRYTANSLDPAWPSEGMSYEGIELRDAVFPQLIHFFGKYQPYGVYLPKRSGPHGIQLSLHADLANHSSLLFTNPRLLQRLGEEVNRIIVSPLGRGPSGWYSGLSERDVLDVLDDVEATYDVDRDKVFGGGYSMGGYGTFRLVALHPDRFAGWITWVAPVEGDCVVGTGTALSCPYFAADASIPDLVGNFRNVPGAMLYAGTDWGVHVDHAAAIADAFRRHDFPYVFYLHPLAEHLTLFLADDWRKEAAYTAGLERQRRPARVTFRTDPALGDSALGLVHDRAYWVSQIVGRAAPAYQDVDLTTYGCGDPVVRTAAGTSAGTDPVPWVSEFRTAIEPIAVAQVNRIEGGLANVRSLVLDAEQACLASGPLAYRLTTDGRTTIRISDGRVLDLPGPGTYEGVIAP